MQSVMRVYHYVLLASCVCMMSAQAATVIAELPESQSVLQASNAGTPVVHQADTTAAEAYKDVIARLLGENREMRFLDAEKKGFLQRLFGG